MCLSLLLGPKNGKWEIYLHSDEKYSFSLTKAFRLEVQLFFFPLVKLNLQTRKK